MALEKNPTEIEEKINLKEINHKKKKKEFEQRELKHKKEIDIYLTHILINALFLSINL